MLASRERLQERQGQDAAPRPEYLQQLVNEFQHSPDVLRKEEIVANLANFAYDPINYTYLWRLRIMDLFLDILDADQDADQDANASSNDETEEQGPATISSSPPRKKLVEFALGGICNCIQDVALRQQFIDGEGVEILAPYILEISVNSAPTSSRELNVAVSALTTAYFLLDSRATSDKIRDKIQTLQHHQSVEIANTAAAFSQYELQQGLHD